MGGFGGGFTSGFGAGASAAGGGSGGGSTGSMMGMMGMMGSGGGSKSQQQQQPPLDLSALIQALMGMSQQFMAPALEQPAPAPGSLSDLKRRLLFMDMLGKM